MPQCYSPVTPDPSPPPTALSAPTIATAPTIAATSPILELWLEQTDATRQKGNHNSKIGGA